MTEYVKENGEGVYEVGGVPFVSFSDTSFTGWTLAVAYTNPSMFPANLVIYTALEYTDRYASPTIEVKGFKTPALVENISARLFVSAGEGDAYYTGDNLRIGPALPLTDDDIVIGSNNPRDDFFCSQINTFLPVFLDPISGKLISEGSSTLDERGTFGTSNSPPESGGVAGARQGWDITSIEVGDRFTPEQTVVYVQGTSSGDFYAITALGLQIQSEGPVFDSVMSIAPLTPVLPGDVVSYTVIFTNSSIIPAENVVFKDLLPQGMVLEPNTFFVNGNLIANPDLVNGVSIDSVMQGTPLTITFDVRINEYFTDYENFATLDYSFRPFSNDDVFDAFVQTNTIVVESEELLPLKANDDTTDAVANIPFNRPSLLSNDTGTDIYVSGFDSVSSRGGNVDVQPDGIYTYTPPSGFLGIDTFNYTITDVAENTDSATVTINVTNIIPLPTSFLGLIKKCRFLNGTDLILNMGWKAPANGAVVQSYRIYYNNNLVEEISGKQTRYVTKVAKIEDAEKYQVSAVYSSGIESERVNIRVIHD